MASSHPGRRGAAPLGLDKNVWIVSYRHVAPPALGKEPAGVFEPAAGARLIAFPELFTGATRARRSCSSQRMGSGLRDRRSELQGARTGRAQSGDSGRAQGFFTGRRVGKVFSMVVRDLPVLSASPAAMPLA
jgi:hypothetical protein